MKKQITKFTKEQESKILALIKCYLNEHEAWGGEIVSQDDQAQTDATEACLRHSRYSFF
jgi:hypothetical protein